jgi:copper chaperone CopZ
MTIKNINMIKKVYKIKDMHCTSCALVIESELEDIGVKARASYAKAEVEVEFEENKLSEKQVIAAIKKAGYSVG